ncbi:MAG TPA: hypothetical protein VGJ17_06125 [Candidatus Limnocylindrales bacterium]|jgi:hypothetical protein
MFGTAVSYGVVAAAVAVVAFVIAAIVELSLGDVGGMLTYVGFAGLSIAVLELVNRKPA